MPSSRIKVQYISCYGKPSLVGEYRMLDTNTGELWDGTERVSVGYRLTGEPGVWTTGRSVVKAICSASTLAEAIANDYDARSVPPASTYADGNPKSVQGAKKYSLRYLPLPAAIAVNHALEDGAKKYGAANWRKTGVAATVYVDAALRHLAQWFDGRQEDAEDSGVHNLGHAMACLAILVDAQANGSLIDDRPLACKDTDALLRREKAHVSK